MPYGGRNPTLNSAEDTIAAVTPGHTPPSHDAATTGIRKSNASRVGVRSVRNGTQDRRGGGGAHRGDEVGDRHAPTGRGGAHRFGRHAAARSTTVTIAASLRFPYPPLLASRAMSSDVDAPSTQAARAGGQAPLPRGLGYAAKRAALGTGAPDGEPGARAPRQGRGARDLQLRRAVLGRLRHRGDAEDAVHRRRRRDRVHPDRAAVRRRSSPSWRSWCSATARRSRRIPRPAAPTSSPRTTSG